MPKTKFTSKTRRGLALVRRLLISSFDESCPPSSTQYARFTKKQVAEYEQALAWMEEQIQEPTKYTGDPCYYPGNQDGDA